MNKIVTFDLSEKGIVNAKKEIKNIIKTINKEVNTEFVSMCLDWIQNRAMYYLNASGGTGQTIINEIQQSFEKIVKVQTGKLVLNHEKGAYVEFGVGAKGDQEKHPKATELGWEYDVDSNAKYPLSRRWTFVLDNGEALNIKYEDITQLTSNKRVYETQGSSGVLFMYNAIMDFANNLEIPAQLYRSAWAKYIGG